MKKTLLPLVWLLCILFITSCQDDKPFSNPQLTPEEKFCSDFAKIFASALNETEFRAFIKKEALKQFDRDYDILYQMIKDEKIGNETVHDILSRYSPSPDHLKEIETNMPLLTIFVPELPNFSAETWKADIETPMVAFLEKNKNFTTLFNSDGATLNLSNDLIPGFPVLVIKQNERVYFGNDNPIDQRRVDKEFFRTENFSYKFIDECFNGIDISKQQSNLRGATGSQIDPINIEAYSSGTDWHRDYIYYGLTPTMPKGRFKNNYSEFIRAIKFNNSDRSLFTDQGDPTVRSIKHGSTSPSWTDGGFEFRVTVVMNSKNGLGNEITKVFTAKGSDLFDVTYVRVNPISLFYKVNTVTPIYYDPNLELIPWDLQTYSTGWKFIVYEYDLDQEKTETFSNTSTFASNFEFDASLGETVKIGQKYGSTTQTNHSFSIKTSLTSDFLGETVLTYDQQVITSTATISGTTIYYTREIDTGVLHLSVEPKKI